MSSVATIPQQPSHLGTCQELKRRQPERKDDTKLVVLEDVPGTTEHGHLKFINQPDSELARSTDTRGLDAKGQGK